MAQEPDNRPLFGSLVISDPAKPHRSRAMPYSLVAHAVAVALVILVPILWPSDPPEQSNPIHALLYDPPPPPPAPLPKGSSLVKKSETVKPTTPERKPDPEKFTAPDEHPRETELKPEDKAPEHEQAGSETGSDIGTPDGMEGGTEGGQVGGVPGGVLGGVVGGTGDVVGDYDQQPRLISQAKPVYPHDAFTKKLEGTVEVGFIIDVDGRVRRAWIVKSIPALDSAAIQAVRQWVFAPALKGGRPVATQHVAPVKFRIY